MKKLNKILLLSGLAVLRCVADDYADWAVANQITGLRSEDDDLDGFSNFHEYAFGSSHGKGDLNARGITSDFTEGRVSVSFFRRDERLSDLVYHLEISDDLKSWERVSAPMINQTPPDADEVEKVTLGCPFPGGGMSLFARVAAGSPELLPVARSYQTNTGISQNTAQRLSDFWSQLDTLDLGDRLVDGYVLRGEFQDASASVIQSLRGASHLTVIGSPRRTQFGMIFENEAPGNLVDPCYLTGEFLFDGGSWSVLECDFRSRFSTADSQRRVFEVRGGNAFPFLIGAHDGTNYRVIARSNSGEVRNLQRSGKFVFGNDYRPLWISNQAADGGILQARTPRGSESVATPGPLSFGQLSIGAGTNNGTTFQYYSDALVGYWLCFDRALTGVEQRTIDRLIDRTLAPKARFVLDGDSIGADQVGHGFWLAEHSRFFGAPLEINHLAVGGQTSIQVAGRIGTPAGINRNLANDGLPTFYLLQAGSNDANDTRNAAETLEQLRLLWATARTQGLQVIACTVPGSIFFDEGKPAEFWFGGGPERSHEVRGQINAGIRAGLGTEFEYLLDVDKILRDRWGDHYWQNPLCFPDGVHPGQGTDNAGPVLMEALWGLIGEAIH